MDNEKKDNIENMEHYMLYGRGEIIQKLRLLGKNKSLLSLHFDGHSMLSTVIDVLSDKNLLVLDYGGSEAMNTRLLAKKSAVVKTDYDGITAQFSTSNIKKARLKGLPTFACDLPEKMLWVQRREFYRVRIPLSETVTCEFTHEDGNKAEYKVLDVSTGGIAIFDPDNDSAFEPGIIFDNCKLVLGDHATSVISLEVRNHIIIDPSDDSKGTRCGLNFVKVPGDFDTSLQKFINMVDLQLKRTE